MGKSNVVRHKKSCGRKKKFKSKEYAYTVASKYTETVVYLCTCCGLYHLGRQTERDKRVAKRHAQG